MKSVFAVLVALLCVGYAPVQAAQKPVFAVVLTRHGVRSPTKMPVAYAWPSWQPVADGNLTKHGYTLMTFAGRYYARSFGPAGLPLQCTPANVFMYADVDQRTIESGRALIEGMCGDPAAIPLYHEAAAATGAKDALFDNGSSPKGAMDSGSGAEAEDAPAFTALQQVLNGRCPAGNCVPVANGPRALATGASDAENLFLEYAECRPVAEIDPGASVDFISQLQSLMQLHVQMSDRQRSSEPAAQVRGGNLLAHIAALLQAKAGEHGNVSGPDISTDSVAFIVGHDTNIANVAGILGAHWSLGDGYVANDTPPGGALVFELLRADDATYHVRLSFVHQTLAQLRNNTELPNGTVRTPVFFEGCGGIDCTMPLRDFSAIADRLAGSGFVRAQWTEASADAVDLPQLSDPAWSRCN